MRHTYETDHYQIEPNDEGGFEASLGMMATADGAVEIDYIYPSANEDFYVFRTQGPEIIEVDEVLDRFRRAINIGMHAGLDLGDMELVAADLKGTTRISKYQINEEEIKELLGGDLSLVRIDSDVMSLVLIDSSRYSDSDSSQWGIIVSGGMRTRFEESIKWQMIDAIYTPAEERLDYASGMGAIATTISLDALMTRIFNSPVMTEDYAA